MVSDWDGYAILTNMFHLPGKKAPAARLEILVHEGKFRNNLHNPSDLGFVDHGVIHGHDGDAFT